jgi:VCBS repeat-containing protein
MLRLVLQQNSKNLIIIRSQALASETEKREAQMKDFVGNAVANRAEVRRSTKSQYPSGPDTRTSGISRALVGALAVTVLAANLVEAATLPDGYVTLDSDMGSARVLADGSLEVTLADGSVRIYAAGNFVVLEGGGIAVSGAVAAELTALAEAVSGVGMAAGAVAGLIGAIAAAAVGGGDAGVNDVAVIGGTTTGSVTEDAAATLATFGTLTVSNADTGEAVFVAQTSVAGTNGHGAFTLGTNGAWSYAANNTQTAIQALGLGDTLTDSFTAVTAGGTTQLVTVTITGVNDVMSAIELSDVEAGTGGFVINGVSEYDESGFSVSSAGDVNGDGFDDLIVGARRDDPNGTSSGASFVVFGKTDGTAVALSDVEAGNGGFVINGVSAGDEAGFSISSAGDVNGDGFDDLIVGALGDDPNGTSSGASFVVFGKTDGTAVELSAVEAGNGGFVINGVSEGDFSGRSVNSAGDVNGDGFDDLIVGAPYDDPNGSSSGASFVVFGKTDGTAVELSDIEAGTGGFVINGVSEGDQSGFSVSSAGDVNGDGFDDLIVGACFDDPNGKNSGASFVVFGGNFSGAVTKIGTVGDDSMSGTTANDVIFAGTGNDTLDSGGGNDRLSGGAGADTFTLRNLDGTATVIDFDGAEGDRLNVSDFGFADFSTFQALLTAEGPGGHDTRITLDADTVVILENITPDDLVASHVML